MRLTAASAKYGCEVIQRAIEPAAEEHADLFAHRLGRGGDLVARPEVAGGRFVAFDGDTLARDFIVWTVGFYVGADPLPIFGHPLGGEAVAEDRDAEQVG